MIFRRTSVMLVEIPATMPRGIQTMWLETVKTLRTFSGYQQKACGFTLETLRELLSKGLVPTNYICMEANFWR